METAPPPGPNSFSFMQCLGKYGKIVCWHPLLGEILDPPLKTLFDQYSFGASCYHLTAKFQRGSVFSHVGLFTTGSRVHRRRSMQAREPTLTLKPRELPWQSSPRILARSHNGILAYECNVITIPRTTFYFGQISVYNSVIGGVIFSESYLPEGRFWKENYTFDVANPEFTTRGCGYQSNILPVFPKDSKRLRKCCS